MVTMDKNKIVKAQLKGDNQVEKSTDASCPEGADETWHFVSEKDTIPGFKMISDFEEPNPPTSR